MYTLTKWHSSFSADPAAALVKVRPINLDVASPESFEQARNWITLCDDEHTECSDWMSDAMPLRVIDVSPSLGDFVCLQETNGRFFHFVALSYCWGTKGFLTTRSVNLSQHMQGIGFSGLPLTMQDAIRCTRQLGLRYIWIDALCIVQDDDVEKHREISRMKDFYRSAYLTISASSAEACQEGFLQKRQSYDPSFELRVACLGGRMGRLQLVELQQQPHPRMILCPGAEPISYRAWTTQESLLSSRVLIYGRLQLFWLCRRTFIGDGGNTIWRVFKNHSAWQQLDLSEKGSCNEELVPNSQFRSSFDKYHNEWTSLICSYSGRNTSYQEDKLPALSAIASLFQN